MFVAFGAERCIFSSLEHAIRVCGRCIAWSFGVWICTIEEEGDCNVHIA